MTQNAQVGLSDVLRVEHETESEIYGDNYCIVWGKVETR